MHIAYNGPDEGIYNLSKFKEFMDDIKAESVYSNENATPFVKRKIEIFHCHNITVRYHAWCELQTFPVTKFQEFYSVEVNLHGEDEDVISLEGKLKEKNK